MAALTASEIRRIVFGLLLGIFLAAIDQTIVAVALLTIARDLGGFSLMAWVASGYLVAATVASPIYGKLGDIYGRRRLLSIAISICLFASLMCALAQTMEQLLVFRLLQGLGGGGLLTLSQAIIADVAPGTERGRYQGYFSGVFATAAVAGPVLGGYLTHYLSWRAIFWLNLPIAIAAFLISRRALARLPVVRRPRTIDYIGAALLASGLAALLIALTRIGQGIAWTAQSTLLLLGSSAALLALCGWQETRAAEPIMPPSLYGNRTVVRCSMVLALSFFVLIGSSILLPLAMQAIGHVQANGVAVRMIPLTLGIPLGAFTSGRMMVRDPHFRRYMLAGTAMATLALLGIVFTPIESPLLLALLMALLGFGIGMPMPPALVATQMSVPASEVGVATATSAFFRSLGGAIGIAVLTSLLWTQLREGAPAGAPMQSLLTEGGRTPEVLQAAFQRVFAVAGMAALLAFLVTLTLPNRPLKMKNFPEPTPKSG